MQLNSLFAKEKGAQGVGKRQDEVGLRIKQEMIEESCHSSNQSEDILHQNKNKKKKTNNEKEVIELIDDDAEMEEVGNTPNEEGHPTEGHPTTIQNKGKTRPANLADKDTEMIENNGDKNEKNDERKIYGKKNDNDRNTRRVQFENPYINEEFKKAKERAEERKVTNISDNKEGTYLSVRFHVRGWHKENESPFSAEAQLYRDILEAILEKGKKIDNSFYIQAWSKELSALKRNEEIRTMVNEENKHRYLHSPKVYRGRSFFRKEIRSGMNNVFSIKVDLMDNRGYIGMNESFCEKWNKTSDGVNNAYIKRIQKDNGEYYEINVLEATLRPIQEEKMEEIGYLYGSVPGQDLTEILKEWEEELKVIPKDVKLGSKWTQPDIGKAIESIWKEASKYERKEKSLRAPMIQVIYANEDNISVLRDIMELLTRKYGQHDQITTNTGEDYELPRLPDGSRGIFIGSYQLQRTQVTRNEIVTMIKFHTKFRSSHDKWIRTNLKDELKEIVSEGKIMTIKEYLLSKRIAPGVFLYHQLIKRTNYIGETIIYLVCNNSFGQSATAKYRDIVEEILELDYDAREAFEEVSIGAVSAMTNDSGPHLKLPSILQPDRYSATLTKMIENERKRIDNVYIEGIKIKDLEEENPTKNPFTRRPKRNMKITCGNTQEEIEELGTMEDPTDTTTPETIEMDNESMISSQRRTDQEEWKVVSHRARNADKAHQMTNNFSIQNIHNMEVNNSRNDNRSTH